MADSHDKAFWSRVDKTDSCWLWRGSLGAYGYGEVRRKGASSTMAHRLAYEALVGPIPPGLTLDHLCRVRACVNPAHLEPVTLAENVLRGESFSAVNARKTHCKRGHEFTPENTFPHPTGRNCRICRNMMNSRWERANRAKKRAEREATQRSAA